MNLTSARLSRRAEGLASLAVIAGLAAWLWPIGLGGKMPVGGDVTQFQMGLMAVLRRALREGRLPLWNDLWGYGFPGLAESQMGVFYPPHWALYRLLSVEVAYTVSLVGHTFWGGLGAAWAARRFGASAGAGALAGLAWGASGFFVIHIPHQWGYTAGSWMPWAWGLAWVASRSEAPGRAAGWLAAVLAVQILPGHFQLAFNTQLGVLLIAGLGYLESRRPAGIGAILAAWMASAPLAAAQLWPTLRLAGLDSSRRDLAYLSDFAGTPLHLVSFVAPGLFHRSPLWRPIAWDPFHTSPEEQLVYVGLAPLFLALGAWMHGCRRDPAVRTLAILTALTLLLSLGPYIPGFGLLARVPGFSFFRSPARWSLSTSLALAILAARGLDLLWQGDWVRAGRSLVRFAILAAIGPALIVGGFEWGLASTAPPGDPVVVRAGDWVLKSLPWPEPPRFTELMAQARRPESSAWLLAKLARRGRFDPTLPGPSLAADRGRVYLQELAPTAALLLTLMGLAPLSGRPKALAIALAGLALIDLVALGRDREVDLGPIQSLNDQSPILGRLARGPRGARLAASLTNPLGNLPMVAGAGPLAAYRTLDLTCMPALTALTRTPRDRPGSGLPVANAFRAGGVAVRLVDPFDGSPRSVDAVPWPGWKVEATLRDPALAGWLFGVDFVRLLGDRADRFSLVRPETPPARAWLLPAHPVPALDLAAVLDLMANAIPLATTSPVPERLNIREFAVDRPATVVITQLDDGGWQGVWDGPGGQQPAILRRAFDGWLSTDPPGPGVWTLQLTYPGREVPLGLATSAVAWLGWLGWTLRVRRPEPEKRSDGPESSSEPRLDRGGGGI